MSRQGRLEDFSVLAQYDTGNKKILAGEAQM
jgi:hypothetical protein